MKYALLLVLLLAPLARAEDPKPAPEPLTNEQIQARLGGPVHRDPRSPERLEQLRKKREAYLKGQAEIKRKDAERRARFWALMDQQQAENNQQNAVVAEQNRIEYNKGVDRWNAQCDAYYQARAAALGAMSAGQCYAPVVFVGR